MTLLRMYAFKPAQPSSRPFLSYQSQTPPPHEEIKTVPTSSAPPLPPTQSIETSRAEAPPVKASSVQVAPKTKPTENHWETLIPQLQLTGLALNAAKQANLILNEDGSALLHFDKHHRPLFTPGVVQKIEAQLSQYYKKNIKLSLQSDSVMPNTPAEKQRIQKKEEHDAHLEMLDADPAFQTLKATFTPD